MFLNKHKITSTLLITVFVFTLFTTTLPTKVSAIPVEDAANYAVNQATYILLQSGMVGGNSPTVAPTAWGGRVAIKLVLRRLTESVVAWIDSGFNGNPSFITNPEDFLRDTADIVIGDFLINNKDLDFLCDPFKINVKLAIGLQYQPFSSNIRCRLTDALANVNGAYDDFVNGDFINGGGWDSWLQITTVPQNNSMGAMILTQNELDARIEGSKNAELAKAQWSGGFLSWEKCTNINTGKSEYGSLGAIQESGRGSARSETEDEFGANVPVGDEEARASLAGSTKGPSNTSCKIETPGTAIVGQYEWAKSSPIRELELTNDLDAIFNALANQVIKYGVDYFSSVLTGDNMNNSDPAATYNAYLNSLQQQQLAGGVSNGTFGGNSGSSNGGAGTNAGGSTSFNENFTSRNSVLTAIANQSTIERQYIEAQDNIFALLDATQEIFANSSCTNAVKSDVEEQITGDFVGTKYLPWNKRDIALATSSATANIRALSTAEDRVESATTDTAVATAIQPLTTMNLNSTTQVDNYEQGGITYNAVRNWVANKIDTYRGTCLGSVSGLSEWGIQ
jgi:hypothetical protein